MAPAKPNKVSRITVACNSCRFRKQKCSGNKPICTQCDQHNRPCDWPEQLKRGPAKGYIEALEHRLHETESLLLNLLAQIPDSQLSASVQGRQDRSSRHRNSGSPPQTYSSSSSRLGKRGTDYWKRFPLHTVQDIRDWQNDCLSNDGDGSTRHSSGPEAVKRPSASQSEYQPETVSPKDQMPEFQGYRDMPTLPRIHQIEIPNSPIDAGSSPAKVAYGSGFDGEARENRPRMDPVFEAIQYQRARAEAVHEFPGMQKPSLWRGAPSVSFQQQFLW
ncbi:transcriptional regulator family: Fungal Specific TF [Aspergillus niger]|uniref:C6 finger domain protein n=1 Tax=Aspergillus niger ATCC 13496 TaxID=1353008 RepID=A0A370BS47_ASPNG|nr:C6 finger domain protein [Aspergillus niger CBS 101883]KAI2817210.1 transcriptional regulator family: Fungal Specific TF [Aspergillus niger]RDH16935.1 C6 finger domain protein [Aspergillus niger ATCC 13496]KAI2848099.1 transcriptional regulator family: Fungal Specific TF [Aspergillus niger]KAI2873043.1 transcriptional regulator family: Fungal Specific TF [Aspergillus niger]KAI2899512.1 transcriptional regulator family: Fungal Specific TF [Aspergillus niger]